jgi:hypothetical protein
VRCHFRSAAVKVMALLTLPAFPRGWQRRFCAALLGERRCDQLRGYHKRICQALL